MKLPALSLPLVVGLVILALGVTLQSSDNIVRRSLGDYAYDWIATGFSRSYQPLPVKVLIIDEASLQRIGAWPWPRSLFAELVERLTAAGAAAIAFDIIFTAPDGASPQRLLSPLMANPSRQEQLAALLAQLPDNDQRFAQALAESRAALGMALTNEPLGPVAPAEVGFALIGDFPHQLPDFNSALAPLPILTANASVGALNVYPAADGRVRRVPVVLRNGQNLYPSLAAEALRLALGQRSYALRGNDPLADSAMTLRIGQLQIPLNARGEAWLDATPSQPARYLSAWQALADDADLSTLQGSIVLVGTSALGLGDRHLTALGETIPGVEIHAQLIEQMLLESHPRRPPWALAVERWLLLGVGLLLLLAMLWLGALWSALGWGVTSALLWGGALYGFTQHHLIFDPLTSTATLTLLFTVVALARYRQSEAQRRFIRNAFASYVPPTLVNHLLRQPKLLRVGGEHRHCSFVFTDLANFTPLVEASEPQQLVDTLNAYLEGMIEIAFDHGGTIDKLIGDAVLVMFSAPVEQPDHAQRAVNCALAMDQFAVAFAKTQQRRGIPFGHTRIGVHSGVVTVGNFGGQKRFDYTAIGDVINTAARLESANKPLGTRVCLSGAALTGSEALAVRPIGELLLKGKRQTLTVYQPLATAKLAPSDADAYQRAYDLLASDPEGARHAFAGLLKALPDDPLVGFHHRRLSQGERGVIIDLS